MEEKNIIYVIVIQCIVSIIYVISLAIYISKKQSTLFTIMIMVTVTIIVVHCMFCAFFSLVGLLRKIYFQKYMLIFSLAFLIDFIINFVAILVDIAQLNLYLMFMELKTFEKISISLFLGSSIIITILIFIIYIYSDFEDSTVYSQNKTPNYQNPNYLPNQYDNQTNETLQYNDQYNNQNNKQSYANFNSNYIQNNNEPYNNYVVMKTTNGNNQSNKIENDNYIPINIPERKFNENPNIYKIDINNKK